MRIFLVMLAVTIVLLGGCRTGQNADLNMKTLQKTVTIQQLNATLDKLPPPPMNRDIMSRPKEEIITWIKQVDDWTHKVLSSPVTGEMDEDAMRGLRDRLMLVYTPEMADKLIGYFYNHDPLVNTYQAVSTDNMLALRSDYHDYDLNISQPSPDQYRIELIGSTKLDQTETRMEHHSLYQLKGDRLLITDFRTS
jgi:hypothetical protein